MKEKEIKPIKWAKTFDHDLPLPAKATPGSIGMDICAAEDVTLKKGEYKAISTGWALALPEWGSLMVFPRSGLAAKHGITVLNTPGLIDSDYRGELKVILINHGEQYEIKKGDRIAQLVYGVGVNYSHTEVVPYEEFDETERGTGGLGSTGD